MEERCCHNCENFIYVGDKGYICDVNNTIVVEDWEPTDAYFYCKGESFDPIEKGGGNMVDKCVVCGNEIPEGRQVCPNCEKA